jgi:hypothetical protein
MEVVETTDKILLCCAFWRTGKGTGQMYHCWWRICREINVFPQVRMSHVLCFISICNWFTDSPSYNNKFFPLLWERDVIIFRLLCDHFCDHLRFFKITWFFLLLCVPAVWEPANWCRICALDAWSPVSRNCWPQVSWVHTSHTEWQ